MSSEIIVVGAGAAGLMAAWKLAEKGHSVTVLEGRNRIGGRIHTITKEFSMPVEAGAEFVHGNQPLTLSLIKQAGLEMTTLEGKNYHVEKGEISKGGFFDDHWGELTAKLQKLKSDTDMAAFLEQNFNGEKYQELRENVRRFVEGYDAADLHRVSALALRDEWAETDEEHQYHITGGYSQLIEFIAGEARKFNARILLSTTIKKIQWGNERVVAVSAGGRSFEADKIVITVPLGILQHGSIEFDPPLREHEKLWESIGYGGVIKFLAEFKTDFWLDVVMKRYKNVAFIFSDAGVPTWWSQRPNDWPLLTGWLGGPVTFRIDHNETALRDEALNSLAYLLSVSPETLTNGIENFRVEDWVTDPSSLGAYGYSSVASQSARALLSQPIQSTLYFAGEAIYEGNAMGTVEAALVSGQDVAKKI
jgi:monoamine oxidase